MEKNTTMLLLIVFVVGLVIGYFVGSGLITGEAFGGTGIRAVELGDGISGTVTKGCCVDPADAGANCSGLSKENCNFPCSWKVNC